MLSLMVTTEVHVKHARCFGFLQAKRQYNTTEFLLASDNHTKFERPCFTNCKNKGCPTS